MKFEELKLGMKDSTTKTISEEDILSFAKISTDTNPIHVNKEAAEKSIFGRQVAHGILVSGLISAVLGTKLPGEGAIYLGQDLRFRKPVFINDTITAEVEVVELREDKHFVILKTTCINQDGVEVITGQATVMVK